MNDKQQLAAMGEHVAAQAGQSGQAQPLCMAKRIEELEAQVRVMVELLRSAVSVISSINHGGEHKVHVEGDEPAFWQRGEWVEWAKCEVLPKLQSALAGNLPEPATPEGWQLVPVDPTQEMVKAVENYRVETWDGGEWISSKKAIGIYRDMIAAAPKPEAS